MGKARQQCEGKQVGKEVAGAVSGNNVGPELGSQGRARNEKWELGRSADGLARCVSLCFDRV